MNPQPGRQLDLQAYDGWSIPNHIDAEPTSGYVSLAENSPNAKILLASTRRLGPPTGRYNCHGLVFASRRTNIPPTGMSYDIDLEQLLLRDQYVRVQQPPQVGDVIVYRGLREIEHTGFVCRIERASSGGTVSVVPTVFVWSMWGGLGEFEHRAQSSPYTDCACEYWRLRR
jgi:hypothetical protein